MKKQIDNSSLVSDGQKREVYSRPNRSKRLLKEFNDAQGADKYMKNAIELYNLPLIDINEPKEVEERSKEYLSIVLKNDCKPTYAGYAFALGIDRVTLINIVSGVSPKRKESLETIKRTLSIISAQFEDWMSNGQINPVSGIFLMKNNFGYKDQQEVVVTPNNPFGEISEQKELESRYLDSIPAEFDDLTEN